MLPNDIKRANQIVQSSHTRDVHFIAFFLISGFRQPELSVVAGLKRRLPFGPFSDVWVLFQIGSQSSLMRFATDVVRQAP